jgi:deazaflavin-dependent oxidoreductase (nitroreductase family)
MPKTLADIDPSKGLLRLGLHLPVTLYRLHLGWLLGTRFLMLTHFGRKTGKPYQTVLEVVSYNRQTGECVIASGWGKKSDWYRNIIKTPQVQVSIGTRKFAAMAEQLSTLNAEKELLTYAQKHRMAFNELYQLMSPIPGETIEENCHNLAQNIPLIMLRPAVPDAVEKLPTE